MRPRTQQLQDIGPATRDHLGKVTTHCSITKFIIFMMATEEELPNAVLLWRFIVKYLHPHLDEMIKS
jgi:hypothetical protein